MPTGKAPSSPPVTWTYHFLRTVHTRNSDLVLRGWRHRVCPGGLLLLLLLLRWRQLGPLFGSRSCGGQRGTRCHDRGGGRGLGRSCGHCGGGGDGGGGDTRRTVAGRSFTLSLNTAAHRGLRHAGVAVSTEAAGAAATVLRSLWIGASPRSQLHQELLSIGRTWLWGLHRSTARRDDGWLLGGKLLFLGKITSSPVFYNWFRL